MFLTISKLLFLKEVSFAKANLKEIKEILWRFIKTNFARVET